jgi:magnesium and cobalt transporter
MTNLEKDKKKSWLHRLKHLFHAEPKNKNDLLHVLREAQQRSLIDAEALSMIEGVILFTQMRVRDIMLPKKQMVCIPQETQLNEVVHLVTKSGHSRFPVLSHHSDEVIGTLHAKDLLPFQASPSLEFDLMDVIRKATVVPESKRLDVLLSDFRITRNHMAIVVDEYGAISGFVTLEDVLEQIIGDIADEFDIDEEAYIKAHGDARYMLHADTPIKEFNQTLNATFSDEIYDTVGGIVMAGFGYLPERGERTTLEGFDFLIVNADARYIKLIECIDNRFNTEQDRTPEDTDV